MPPCVQKPCVTVILATAASHCVFQWHSSDQWCWCSKTSLNGCCFPSRNPWLKMTQQMHNLSLLQNKKHSMPSSPNAAKRLYRNLSEKLKGSHTSFDEAYFRARSDRLSLRKASVVITRSLSNCQFTFLLISLISWLLICTVLIISLCSLPSALCASQPYHLWSFVKIEFDLLEE